MHPPRVGVRSMVGVVAVLVALCSILAARAQASPSVKTVRYHGYRLTVPAGWPVFRVGANSTTCVRFNRHAVYLGTPSRAQRCPAQAAGRTEAILVTPSPASFSTSVAAAPTTRPAAQAATGSETQLIKPGLEVTATWSHDPAAIRRALGLSRLQPSSTTPQLERSSRASASVQSEVRAARTAAGSIYTGRGFDACSTPSSRAMSAWGSSPYRALGIYIGGANSACAQPNLNSTWMATQWAAGWHVMPIYVGLQAPSNSCGCAGITPGRAASQGTAAAADAISHAQAVGIGAGNPIYFDMEGYSRTSANTSAVLNFLAAWTTQLHAAGYGSGVYSSGGSGIADLVSRAGTSYAEPDDIWVGDWNGQATTSDPYVPSSDWSSHQRVHQYRGGHNETYGGATINIDGDYLDAATAFGGATAAPAVAPSVRATPTAPGPINLVASWLGMGGISRWRILGGSSPSSLSLLGTSKRTTVAESSVFAYYEVQAVSSTGQILGTSPPASPRPHVAVYGRSAFVPGSGTVGVPVGCVTGSACQIRLTVHAGHALIASTGAQALSGSGGLLYFRLSSAGRRLLRRAFSRRLAVKITARDVSSGRSATASMKLIPYATSGKGPRLSSTHSGGVKFLGLRDFVYQGRSGGILASCVGSTPCLVKTKITARNHTVATTGPELIGANSVAYLSYGLTAYGRALMATARSNQLGAQVAVSGPTGSARGGLALIGFH